jgi:hypothetical protein
MSKRADKAGGEPFGIDPISIFMLFLDLLPKILPLFAACKVQPPPPPPLPSVLAAVGVTPETWQQAHGAKFASGKSANKDGSGFSNIAIRRCSVEIAKAKGIKKKAARPLAIASLETGRDETVDEIAVAMQQAKSNAAALGA